MKLFVVGVRLGVYDDAGVVVDSMNALYYQRRSSHRFEDLSESLSCSALERCCSP